MHKETSQSTKGTTSNRSVAAPLFLNENQHGEMEMSTLAPGRSGAARCGREKQVRGGRRRLARSGGTELMKWRRRATSGATNEAAAAAEREGTAEEPADSSVLMRSVRGGEGRQGCSQFHCGSRCDRTEETLPCEVQRQSGQDRHGNLAVVYRRHSSTVLGEKNCWPIVRQGADGALAAQALLTPRSERLRSTNHSKRFFPHLTGGS